MVMGGDSCAKGCELKSRHVYWMDFFSHLFVVKFVLCVRKDENKNEKEAGLALFKKTIT